jgi:tryptophan-rich sensory protein
VDVLFLPLACILTVLGSIWAFVWIRGTIREVETRSGILRAGLVSFAATYVLLIFATNLLLVGSKPHIALLVGLLGALTVAAFVVVLSKKRISSGGDSATNNRWRGP